MAQAASDILNKAADHIAQYGLFVGMPGHGPGDIDTAPACAIGAIHVGTDSGESSNRAMDALRTHIGGCIPTWSDSHTADEVIETLRAVAIIAAAQEVDVRVVAPEAELTAVSLAEVAGAVTA